MKKFTVILATVILSLFQHFCLAQKQSSRVVDSLLLGLVKAKEDTHKVNLLNDLCVQCFQQSNYDTALYYAQQAKQYAEKIGFKKGSSAAYNNIGSVYAEKIKYDETLKNYFAALKINEATHDKKEIANSNSNIGNVYSRQGNFIEALKYYLVALKINEEIGDREEIAYLHNNIGLVYERLGKYSEALKNYFSSLKINEKIGDQSGIAGSYHNIGTIYFNQSNYIEALNNYLRSLKIKEELGDKRGIASTYDAIGKIHMRQMNYPEALKNQFASLKINKEIGNKQGIAGSYNSLGNTYQAKHNFSESLNYFFASLKINEKISDKRAMAGNYCNIGFAYYSQGNFEEALKFYFMSLKISEEMGLKLMNATTYNGIGDTYTVLHRAKEGKEWLQKGLSMGKELRAKFFIKNSYRGLSATDSALGNYKSAYENYKKFVLYRDSIVNEEDTKKLTQAGMQYEFNKKEAATKAEQDKKDALALEEIKKQKLVRNGFIGGFAVVLVFSGVFFRQHRKIKKGNFELKLAKERAEHSEKMEQQFLANMSHEIRTPMNAVIGMTNLLLNTTFNSKQKFYLNGIKQSSDNLLRIINDILDISKIEAGKVDLEKIDFSIKTVAKQVTQTLQHRAEEKGLELVLTIDSAISDIVLGDPGRLSQVLINLAGNAIKFTEKGSVAIEIKKINGGIKFSIIDTGIGIPKDKLKTVFESFSQANTSDTRKYGGTGLGLAISRQLVELMGGKIALESVEDSGTTFSFILQFEDGSEAGLERQHTGEEQIDGSILDSLTILVVDDNEYNRIVAKDTLESKSKAKIIVAASAREAISLLKETTFHLILMDVQMPEMNGFEATRYIRENFDAPVKNTPIIALTASVLRTDLDKCVAAGMNSYIPKPFKTSQLIAGIAQALNIKLKYENQNEMKTVSSGNTDKIVTNLEYLRKFCEGDETKMKKYIHLFTSSAPALIEKINVALQKNDFAEIANQIHGFKTKWVMMGMTETKNLAVEIEYQCREGRADEKLSSGITDLLRQVNASIVELS